MPRFGQYNPLPLEIAYNPCIEAWVDRKAKLDGCRHTHPIRIRSPELSAHNTVQPSTDERTHIRLSHLEREEMAFT